MNELDTMLEKHQSKFKLEAWKEYTEEELEWWIKLFTKRASHRTDTIKIEKDLTDARNYQIMLDKKRS